MVRNCCLKSSRVGGSARSLTPATGTTTLIDPFAEGPEPESLMGLADFGHLGGDLLLRHTHFHLAHQRLGPRGLAGEADAEQFAHRTAPAVTADEIARTQLFPVGQLDGHTLVVLLEIGHRTTAPDLRTQFDRMFFEQVNDDRLRDAQQIGVRGIQALGRGFVDGGEEAAGRTLSSVFENALQQSAHCHQLETANMQTDYADERHGLGFLLQNEYPHIVQPQFGGQHRTSRPAPGNDHVEHEGRAIGAGGRRWESGDVAHGGVALDRIVRRRLGGELQRVHRCCLSGVPCWRGAPGDTYVNRPTVTGRGSTHIDTAFMGLTSSGGVTVNCKLQARASSRPVLSPPRDHDSKRARAAAMLIRVCHHQAMAVLSPSCGWLLPGQLFR